MSDRLKETDSTNLTNFHLVAQQKAKSLARIQIVKLDDLKQLNAFHESLGSITQIFLQIQPP